MKKQKGKTLPRKKSTARIATPGQIKTAYSRLQKRFQKVQAQAQAQNHKPSLSKLNTATKAIAQKVKAYQKNPNNAKKFVTAIANTAKTLETIQKQLKKAKQTQARATKKKSQTTKKTTNGSDRVPTYIPNFDPLIEGGLQTNSINLLIGSSGSGKSILAMQFLVEAMRRKEKCLYVTFEEKKDQFYKNMLEFGWDLADFEKKGLLTFLEYTPIKVKTMLEEGGGTIESVIIKKKVSRMIIDSVTSFALLFENELEKRSASLALFNMISDWNCTSILTYEGETLKDQKTAARTLEFESDGIIVLYYLRKSNERARYIEVLKMRGTKHSKKIYGFQIDETGITVQKKPATGLRIKE